MRRGYVSFLEGVAEEYQTDRVVHIGDLVDWAALSFHEKNPGLSGANDERRKARRQVKALHAAFPVADWLLGNHDVLPARKARTAGLLDDMLRDPADYWGVEGWTVHDRFASLTIDGVRYSHGETGSGGMYPNANQVKQAFQSIVIGHHHASGGVYWYANHDFRVFGLSVGCGMDAKKLQFEYGRKFNRKPVLGCGVVLDGERAYFEPWLLRSR